MYQQGTCIQVRSNGKLLEKFMYMCAVMKLLNQYHFLVTYHTTSRSNLINAKLLITWFSFSQLVNSTTGKHVEYQFNNLSNMLGSNQRKSHSHALIKKKDETYNVFINLKKSSYGSLPENLGHPNSPQSEQRCQLKR